jgi:hypothetical protein
LKLLDVLETALVAAPADYEVTGIKTFIVSYEGIVYEKDLGANTVEEFRAMERYNPDSTWQVVRDPGHFARDSVPANDVFPRQGPAPSNGSSWSTRRATTAWMIKR